jgi:hypothetical protein
MWQYGTVYRCEHCDEPWREPRWLGGTVEEAEEFQGFYDRELAQWKEHVRTCAHTHDREEESNG